MLFVVFEGVGSMSQTTGVAYLKQHGVVATVGTTLGSSVMATGEMAMLSPGPPTLSFV